MNIADYLSELLLEYSEVSVPGLGCFIRVRKNAWYDDKAAKFYPPYYQVKFVTQQKDDDLLVKYLAGKKNISIASSKYFSEKYISDLKEQAANDKIAFAELGWFVTENNELVFKPNDKLSNDHSFYGYPPVNIYKLGYKPAKLEEQPARAEEKPTRAEEQIVQAAEKPARLEEKPVRLQDKQNPVVAQTAPEPDASSFMTFMPLKASAKEEYLEEETEKKKKVNIWLVLFIVLIVAALGAFGVYKFDQPLFKKLKVIYSKAFNSKNEFVPILKADTAKQLAVKPDSALKISPAKDTVKALKDTELAKKPHFEIIVGQSKTLTLANAQIDYFKTMGVEAKISPNATGKLYKISAGSYLTYTAANSAMAELLSSGKIKIEDSYIIPINPKK